MRPSIISLFLAAGATALPRRPCKRPGQGQNLSAFSAHRGEVDVPEVEVTRARPSVSKGARPQTSPEVSIPKTSPSQTPATNDETESNASEDYEEPESDVSAPAPSAPAKSAPVAIVPEESTSEESAPAAPVEAPASGGTSSVSGLPSSWKPGAKWQIVIDDPVDITKPLNPPDAQVWVVDYFHSVENPDIIPKLVSEPAILPLHIAEIMY